MTLRSSASLLALALLAFVGWRFVPTDRSPRTESSSAEPSPDLTSNADETTLADASRTLVSVEGAVGEDSDVRFTLVQALRDLAAAARAIRTLSESLERNPNALITGKTARRQ